MLIYFRLIKFLQGTLINSLKSDGQAYKKSLHKVHELLSAALCREGMRVQTNIALFYQAPRLAG